LSQDELARAVSINEMTVANWEKGDRMPPRYAKVQRLYEALGLSYPETVDRFGPVNAHTHFGAMARKARMKMVLTQEQAARLAGIDPGTLGRWERSERQPPEWMRSKYAALCEALRQ